MKFEPDVSEWTDEQLEDARVYYINELEEFKRAFEGVTDLSDPFVKVYLYTIDTIQTEIMERELLVKS